MENENLPMKKRNFFEKIQDFFKNFFKKEKAKPIEYAFEKEEYVKPDMDQYEQEFWESIKVYNQEHEDQSLIVLQKELESRKIVVEDLSEEQIKRLNYLYDRQIEALRYKVQNEEMEILSLERKIESLDT